MRFISISGSVPPFGEGSSRRPEAQLGAVRWIRARGSLPRPDRFPILAGRALGTILPSTTQRSPSGRCFLPALFPLSLISVYATFSSRCHFRAGAGRGEEEEEQRRQ